VSTTSDLKKYIGSYPTALGIVQAPLGPQRIKALAIMGYWYFKIGPPEVLSNFKSTRYSSDSRCCGPDGFAIQFQTIACTIVKVHLVMIQGLVGLLVHGFRYQTT